jgi:hypothetical protein
VALEKVKTVRTHDSSYWKITRIELNIPSKVVGVEIGLFKDRASSSDRGNMVERIQRKWNVSDNLATIRDMKVIDMIGFAYSKTKESVMESRQVEEDGVPQVDEDGKRIMEDYETNYFADANDVIE